MAPSSRPPPLSFVGNERPDSEILTPPQPRFITESNTNSGRSSVDGDIGEILVSTPNHDRNISHNTILGSANDPFDPVHSQGGTPPITPRSVTFGVPSSSRPFSSPPQSVISFDSMGSIGGVGHIPGSGYFGDVRPGFGSVANSIVDLPRHTIYGSRPGTSDQSILSSAANSMYRLRESFQPPPARPVTLYSSVSNTKLIRERPKSTMLEPDQVLDKPWLSKKDPWERAAYWATYAVMFLGVVAGALKCFSDWKSVPVIKGNLCPVLEETFDSADGIFGDNGKFFHEVDMSGFGNGEFEMTTSSLNNSFVRDGRLYLVPTLTSDSIPINQILNGTVYNLTDCTFNITQGTTYTGSSQHPVTPLFNTSGISADTFDAEGYYRACSAVSNITAGTIINPVQSARISTRKSASIRYGKVEVVAKIPTGDWLWPAIWMLPVDEKYGSWPLSGEIDIMEARGNGITYPKQGADYVRGSLNWGPTVLLNAVAKTYGWWKLRRGSYDQSFHTYTLEWTEDFIRMSVDSRLHHMLNFKVKKSFWDFGEFPASVPNGTDTVVLTNPWASGSKAAPFDQRFYLILNVAVGGTNGWFPDGPEKPWFDGSPGTAMRDFFNAKDKWYPTWPQNVDERAFVIDSVKMWQLC